MIAHSVSSDSRCASGSSAPSSGCALTHLEDCEGFYSHTPGDCEDSQSAYRHEHPSLSAPERDTWTLHILFKKACNDAPSSGLSALQFSGDDVDMLQV